MGACQISVQPSRRWVFRCKVVYGLFTLLIVGGLLIRQLRPKNGLTLLWRQPPDLLRRVPGLLEYLAHLLVVGGLLIRQLRPKNGFTLLWRQPPDLLRRVPGLLEYLAHLLVVGGLLDSPTPSQERSSAARSAPVPGLLEYLAHLLVVGGLLIRQLRPKNGFTLLWRLLRRVPGLLEYLAHLLVGLIRQLRASRSSGVSRPICSGVYPACSNISLTCSL